jgi:bifunctional DNA-binding transcriptional regulator/antitoxin component of YhaV-PrlF toxin-antitoxin module
LNLPEERHSHGLRRLAAIESSRGSFQDAVEAIERGTGVSVGKRQTEQLAARAAADVEDFYATRRQLGVKDGDVLVISADGKGIVMRPESLRPATAAKAQAATSKLETRLSKGEKRNRKRLAEVGAVYDLTPRARTPDDIMANEDDGRAVPAPEAKNKWLTASVLDDASEVVKAVFDEAERRDPTHARIWVVLIDGNNHQIERVITEAAARSVTITIVIDFVHVLEYLWGAAWSFYGEGDTAAEAWVHDRAIAVLEGRATEVAAGIRRRATTARVPGTKRKGADAAARYLVNKAPYLDYPTALAAGWQIATGVIEGACRHLVKDRMDITGARWSARGAEAVLKLRAVRANGDFDAYWEHHLRQERHRVHAACYAHSIIPVAA